MSIVSESDSTLKGIQDDDLDMRATGDSDSGSSHELSDEEKAEDDLDRTFEDPEFSEDWPSFPDGDVVMLFNLQDCPNWFYHADWCWRSDKVKELVHFVHGQGKFTSFLCKGVLQCSDCKLELRAPTASDKKILAEALDRGCPTCSKKGKGSQALVHVKCKSKMHLTQYKDAQIGVLEHKGTHSHGRPPVFKPRPSSKVS